MSFQCGICFENVTLKTKSVTCIQCEKPVHYKCWLKWSSKCGRCIYCNYQIIDKETKIFSSSDEEAEIYERFLDQDEFYETDSSDEDWTPAYELRIIAGNRPLLRPRQN